MKGVSLWPKIGGYTNFSMGNPKNDLKIHIHTHHVMRFLEKMPLKRKRIIVFILQ